MDSCPHVLIAGRSLAGTSTPCLVSPHETDEAEPCHRLALLESGRIVADGTPKQLCDALLARVWLLRSENTRAAEAALRKQPAILGVAQIGTDLRVLADPGLDEAALQSLLPGRVISIDAVAPNLEDVFVAATRIGVLSVHVADPEDVATPQARLWVWIGRLAALVGHLLALRARYGESIVVGRGAAEVGMGEGSGGDVVSRRNLSVGKGGRGPGTTIRQPEFEDARKAAEALGQPLRAVQKAARKGKA